jgi:beta-mannosidase
VHWDLVRHGVIAPPFQARYELGCQWVDRDEWIYAVEFEATAAKSLPQRYLQFCGLDTVCVVTLNGERIASHDNMFVPLEVNVSGLLREGKNRLEIHFLPAERVGRERRTAYFTRNGLPEDVVRFDASAFVRKAPYMFGWDWGPRLVSAGIWKPVNLVEFEARFIDVHVTQHHAGGSVTVRCESTMEGRGQVVHFWRSADSATWQRIADGGSLELRNPALWWPRGLGPASLHELRSYVVATGSQHLSVRECEEVCLDRRVTRVGLRTVELERRADAWGQSFCFKVNGTSVWCVGANWIPDHSFPSRVTKARLEEQFRRVVDMNMNMLRVWGGGTYESDEFYDLCDELGILVWQDFPFACNYAPDGPEILGSIEEEAAAAIRRLRNRPSLALWCGNNENQMMFEAKWDDATKHPERCHGERIWEELLPGLLTELDPERPYISTSPHSTGVGQLANSDESGDQHNWDVWHGRGDWVHYRESRARFASEYGFASAPSPKAWRQIFGDEDWATKDVRSPLAQWHDKTKKGYETFLGFVQQHYPASRDLEHWTYVSQLNQRDALTTAIEHYRSSDFCAGSLIWQLNDCWPVQSWSVLDNTGAYKASAFALRRLYAACLATLTFRGTGAQRRLVVHAVLDNCPTPREETLQLEFRDSRSGVVLARWTRPIRLQPGQREVAFECDVGQYPPTRTVVWCDFGGHSTFRLFCEPKDLETEQPGWTARYENGELLLTSTVPALDVWVQPDGVEVAENFVSLREAGTIRLAASGPTAQVQLHWIGGRGNVSVFGGGIDSGDFNRER